MTAQASPAVLAKHNLVPLQLQWFYEGEMIPAISLAKSLLEDGVKLFPGLPTQVVQKLGSLGCGPVCTVRWGSPEEARLAAKYAVPLVELQRVLRGITSPSLELGNALQSEGIVVPYYSPAWCALEWRPLFVEDVFALADRLQVPCAAIAAILDHTATPAFQLAGHLQDVTRIHRDIWLRPELHPNHPVYLCPAHSSPVPEPVTTSKQAAELWGNGGFELVARAVEMPAELLVHIVYRRISVKIDWAAKLEAATGVLYVEFLRSRVSTDAAFIGTLPDWAN